MGRLNGKVALVSGAGSGIGRATAECFASEGAVVYVGDVDLASAQDLALAGRGQALRLDVTEPPSWDEAFSTISDAHEGLDALVNCAGVAGSRDNIVECPDDEWRRVMAVNLDGTFLGIKMAVPMMQRRRGGAIVNMSSVLAVVGDGETLSYAASKGAVRGLTKSVALEVASYGIRCNSIHPGYIQTPMTERWLDELRSKGQGHKDLEALHPLGRLGDPTEVAQLAVYLVSDEASFVTGAELPIDGGYLAV